MPIYAAYGLTMESDLSLPELSPTEGTPDVRVLLRSIHDDELDVMSSHPDRIWGSIHKDIQFIIEGGHSIHVDVRSSINEDEVRGFVTGVLMATLLRQRGYLVLHASAVAMDGFAIGFIGESGWGKSSLAEYFCQQGFTLINDDVMAIDVRQDAHPVVMPGYPYIRLRPEAGRHLRPDFQDLPLMENRGGKRVRNVETVVAEPVPLQRLYLLEPQPRLQTRIVPLPKPVATFGLVTHTRATNLINEGAVATAHLQQCATLAQQIPVCQLERENDLSRLSEIHRLVLAELEDLKVGVIE